MLKFLRKYNKFILVIGGSLLMVAFLAPQAIQQLGRVNNRTIGTLEGRKIKQSDLMLASREIRALNMLGGTNGAATLLLRLNTESSSDADLHWFLLSREAEEAGLVGSDLDGRSYYPVLAQQIALLVAQNDPGIGQLAQQFGPQFAQQLIQRRAAEQAPAWLERIEQSENAAAGAARFTSIEDLHRAVAKMRGVQRLRSAYNNAVSISDPRLLTQARERFKRAQVDAVVVPAERYLDAVAEPTEDEIAAHFERYADVDPRTSDNGIGYLQDQRVKLEWIEFDADAIADAVNITALELSKHWQLNRDRFPGEFSAERESVDAELRGQRVAALLDDIEQYVQASVLRETRDLSPINEYLELPEDWASRRPTLESIAQDVTERVREAEGIELPAPTIERIDDRWSTYQDLQAIEDFGFSQVRAGSVQVFGAAAPLQVRELLDTDDDARLRMPIQVGLLATNYPLVQTNGTRRFFRVLDARDVSAPDSLDEVREQVVVDLKRLAAYEVLKAEVEQFADVARLGGLDAVVEALNAGLPEDDQSRVSIQEDLLLTAQPRQGTPAVFQDQEALDAVFAAAATIDPATDPETIPQEDRVFATTSLQTLSAAVGSFDYVRPLSAEEFRTESQQMANVLVEREVRDLGVVDSPFSLERMIERHAWTPRATGDEDDAPAANDTSDTEPAPEPDPAK